MTDPTKSAPKRARKPASKVDPLFAMREADSTVERWPSIPRRQDRDDYRAKGALSDLDEPSDDEAID